MILSCESYWESGIPPTGCSIETIYRKVWWVHGYQGNESSLSRPGHYVGAAATGLYQARSYFPDYNSSQTTLQAAADNLKVDILDVTANQVNTERNFIIAHSMGGLVARKLGVLRNPVGLPYYNGFITFGTPHRGAYAADVLVEHPEFVSAVLTNACQALGKGPLLEAVNNSGTIGATLVLFGALGGTLDSGCENLADVAFPAVRAFATVGVEPELTTSAVNTVTIPPMATANNAVFYGIEDDDNETLTARFMGSILNSPTGEDVALFGADALDAVGIAAVASAQSSYVTKMNMWQFIHDGLCAGSLFGLCWSSAEQIADGYREGVNWFTELNPTWKHLIGAERVDLVEEGCECTNVFGQTYTFSNPNCSSVYVGYPWQFCNDVYTYKSNSYPSDGFILAESAMNGPGVNYERQFMPGSNHMQMRNDSQMEQAVYKIFESGIEPLRGFFNTEQR